MKGEKFFYFWGALAYLITDTIIFACMGAELTYYYDKLQEIIPEATSEELKEINDIVYKERKLYSEITLARIARLIAKRTLELSPKNNFPFF
jgi:hypothetical protein